MYLLVWVHFDKNFGNLDPYPEMVLFFKSTHKLIMSSK